MNISKEILKIKAVIFILGLVVLGLCLPFIHKPRLYRSTAEHTFRLLTMSKRSGGTGFTVVAPSGKLYTLTNKHICMAADEQGQLLAERNGRFTTLKIIEIYMLHDLCLLNALPGQTDGIELASGYGQENGDTQYIIGYPLLFDKTVSEGNVGSLHDIEIIIGYAKDKGYCESLGMREEEVFDNFSIDKVCIASFKAVSSSAQSYPGNSGSPVVNIWGNLEGVLFAGDQTMYHSLIVPIISVKDFLRDY